MCSSPSFQQMNLSVPLSYTTIIVRLSWKTHFLIIRTVCTPNWRSWYTLYNASQCNNDIKTKTNQKDLSPEHSTVFVHVFAPQYFCPLPLCHSPFPSIYLHCPFLSVLLFCVCCSCAWKLHQIQTGITDEIASPGWWFIRPLITSSSSSLSSLSDSLFILLCFAG